MASSSSSTTSPGLRDRLRAGETLVGTFLNSGSAIAAEITGQAGFDWLLIDLEHGSGSEADLQHLLHAVGNTVAAPIVRVESGARPRVARALDLGAEGIMFPQLQGTDEAMAAVSYLKYPPQGIRGLAFFNRAHAFARGNMATVAAANERAVCMIQIESEGALESVEEIAALDGVDVLFVGPTDLSLSLGILARFDHPRYLGAVERVAAAAHGSGKVAGVLVPSAEGLDPYLAEGFRLLAVGSDGGFLAAGAKRTVEATRARARA